MSKLAERITDLALKDDLDEAIEDAIRTCGGVLVSPLAR